MPALILALALAAADAPPAPAADTAPAAATTSTAPAGSTAPAAMIGAVDAGAAPTDDFGFVAWCAGAVEGYLKLKPAIFPEVTRIETQFQRPGTRVEDDLKDYADLEAEARRQMKLYQRAIQTAEKASTTDLSARGFAAYKRGLAVWAAPAGATKARIAQEWMSWALPAKCETTAKTLTTKASLLGEALNPTSGSKAETAASPSEAAPATTDTAALPPAAAEAAPAAPAATDQAAADAWAAATKPSASSKAAPASAKPSKKATSAKAPAKKKKG